MQELGNCRVAEKGTGIEKTQKGRKRKRGEERKGEVVQLELFHATRMVQAFHDTRVLRCACSFLARLAVFAAERYPAQFRARRPGARTRPSRRSQAIARDFQRVAGGRQVGTRDLQEVSRKMEVARGLQEVSKRLQEVATGHQRAASGLQEVRGARDHRKRTIKKPQDSQIQKFRLQKVPVVPRRSWRWFVSSSSAASLLGTCRAQPT